MGTAGARPDGPPDRPFDRAELAQRTAALRDHARVLSQIPGDITRVVAQGSRRAVPPPRRVWSPAQRRPRDLQRIALPIAAIVLLVLLCVVVALVIG